MAEFLHDLNIHGAGQIQFKTTAGTNAGKIDQNGNDLVLTNAVGDILLGDGSSDVFIGDGTNNVDIIFEQSGAIKGDGSAVTLTLGGSNTTLNLENPNFNGAVTMNSKLTFGTTNGFILFDYEPSGDTGAYATEVPLIKVDRSGEESTILARISEYRGVVLGVDDTVWLRAGDTGSVIKANVNLANEVVLMSAESGFHAYGFPGNDTTWSNRNEFKFYSASTTAANNGLYIGDGGSTQFIDLSRNLKNIGTISNTGDVTITNGNIIFSSQYGIRFTDANTRIYTNTDSPEDLIIEADQDLLLTPDGQVSITGDLDVSGTAEAPTLYGNHANGNGSSLILGRADTSNYWHVNHAGADFRLYNAASSGSHILFGVDASGTVKANSVGIGTATPSEKLHVVGNIKASGELEGTSLDINGTSDISGNAVFHGKSSFGGTTSNVYNVHVKGTGWAGSGVAIESTTTSGAVLSLFNTDRQFQIASRGSTLDFRDITDSDTRRFFVDSTGHLQPGADSSYSLGTNSNRWSNVYADTLYGDGSNITGITSTDNTKLPLTGGTLTGDLTISSTAPNLILEDTNGRSIEMDINGNTFRIDDVGNNAAIFTSDLSTNPVQTTFGGPLSAGSHSLTGGSLDINGNADISGNITVGGTVDGVDIATLASNNTGTNTGDQDLSSYISDAAASNITSRKTFTHVDGLQILSGNQGNAIRLVTNNYGSQIADSFFRQHS